MTELIEFLLERIEADEAAARYAATRDGKLSDHDTAGWWLGHYRHYTRHDPHRVLAECAALREVVALHTPLEGEFCCPSCGDLAEYCRTLPALAGCYREQP